MGAHVDNQAGRPPPDQVFTDIAEYVHNYKIDSPEAFDTARLTLMDTIGCKSLFLLWRRCEQANCHRSPGPPSHMGRHV